MSDQDEFESGFSTSTKIFFDVEKIHQHYRGLLSAQISLRLFPVLADNLMDVRVYSKWDRRVRSVSAAPSTLIDSWR